MAKVQREVHGGGYHHGDLRRALLESAESVLEETGVEGFSLRECARRAGVSHGAPAHHFKGVRGLLTELTADSFRQLNEIALRQRETTPPETFGQVLSLSQAYLGYALAHPARFQLLFRSDVLDYANERLLSEGSRFFQQLHQSVTQSRPGSTEPEKKMDNARMAIVWALAHGFAELFRQNIHFIKLFEDNGADPQRDLMDLLELLQPVVGAGRPNEVPVPRTD